MISKLIGGSLLIIGTTIGAGMLALPIATAQLGFWGSLVLLISCWAMMTACAFLFLEALLWLPPNSNFVSIAGATLGRGGQVVAWLFYLLLLYSILSAYIAGGGDLFHYLLSSQGVAIPLWGGSLLFTALFGAIVYLGIKSVDYVNRGLMLGKMGAFLLLVCLVLPFVTVENLNNRETQPTQMATSVAVTVVSFTCLMVIPSLRTYFKDDVKLLRKAIFIGTLVPLICYIVWDMVVMGIIPFNGEPGLKQILLSTNQNSALVATLTSLLQKNNVTVLTKFFTSICMATSFLSVSLCLSDFLADGFNVSKKGLGKFIIFGATFLPPVLIVLFCPNMFIKGLSYAGLSCFVLMVLLPPLMVWRGRYHLSLDQRSYRAPGGKLFLGTLLLFATFMVGIGIKSVI